jgi:2,3-diketo-5-methylthio-1-phosphopentane phosphatase
MGYSLFIDFDGTTASVDVGNRLFAKFTGGRNEALVERWKRLEIGSVECLTGEANLFKATESEVVTYALQFSIDSGFRMLFDVCSTNDIPIYIVSDGLDTYINAIMRAHGFAQIPVLANRGIFKDGKLRVEFPHKDKSCPRCGTCKGAAIRKLKRAGDESIFIGDGYSDLCAIDVADYLFAKGDLAEYLARSGKAFLPFQGLNEVAEQVLRLTQQQR